ncbi:hypothetical protein HIM_06297 [Hirsutella minnesotensis 3608]|uniref:Mitochondrial adapter protein MCP1 transmembrane domain-containing protein n=1 Tax=Hirsutella minnesotensis 3608 TaxID=1043627 RepID=A0A0F7ZJC8_9HYPO|nr:hypothetical protein HIM_06297 [Hirsutella minnesotensis 3608]
MDSPRREERRDSQQTFISLLQLDPSPIDAPSSPAQDKELPPLPNDGQGHQGASTTGAPGLSGSGGRGAIYYLTRVQRYSSYAMSIFTSLHMANVSLIPLVTRSVAGSETYMLMTREIYQTTLAEPLLVGLPVLAHIGSGVALRLVRRWQNMRRYGGGTPGMYALHRRMQGDKAGSRGVRLWPQLSYISASGYLFTLLYAAHVLVNRALPLAVEGDSSNIGLAYVAHSFARHPRLSLVAYAGLIGVGVGHMVWGMAKWLGLAPSTDGAVGQASGMVDKKTRRQRRRKWLGVHGWIAKLYDDLFARVRL